eukprot:CAMPEP_0182423782 /NCGR_PEP_ID=MMETSP1167-20130531/9864_1 /TAXON_ID=2988 /ORGANISM="Mallomonas Sp, Strain CCMP3275" /LENGTH=354 /DNA_ID=CAMNT_0024603057 /DNA_START=34 /DNA_END=1098 /DNA_ORIENTATION=+
MTDIKRFGDTGIHTVEGNIAGSRAARLSKQRDAQKAEYETVKNEIKKQNAAGVGRIDDKFNAASDSIENEFRKQTVGLVTANDFRKAMTIANETRVQKKRNAEQEEKEKIQLKKDQREMKRKKMAASLSFSMDENDEESLEDNETENTILTNNTNKLVLKKKLSKDPSIITSFLPDRERDQLIKEETERIQNEWMEQQTIIKNELLEVVYSYWDGSGHRKSIEIKKGTTIGKFLELVKGQLAGEFHEMRNVSADNLIYVKEDLIIPQHFSFYDLIITKARGKSGPLFHFDVHEDIRLMNDARVEKDESHPGKVVERRWYERNKHIFPASRWEVYDPTVQRDKYTIHGDEVKHKK